MEDHIFAPHIEGTRVIQNSSLNSILEAGLNASDVVETADSFPFSSSQGFTICPIHA